MGTQGAVGRWWLPGAAVAAGALVVGWVAAGLWYAYEAGDCGNPGAKFACLVEGLVASAAAVVLGPLVLWWAFRRAGVQRAFPSVLVSAGVALVLLTGVPLQEQVRLLAGEEVRPGDPPPAVLVGVWLGLAVLGGGLALQGPRRLLRAVPAAAALVVLVGATVLLQAPAERAGDRLELDRARVPLLLATGWQPYGTYVSDTGVLAYDAVPEGWEGYGGYGIDVRVGGDPADLGESCSYRPCTDVGGIRAEVPDDDGSMTAWRVVDGHLVTVTRYSRPPERRRLDPVEVLQGLVEVDREQFLDRRYSEPVAAGPAGEAQRT